MGSERYREMNGDPSIPFTSLMVLATSNYQRKTTTAKITQLQNIWVRERERVGSRGAGGRKTGRVRNKCTVSHRHSQHSAKHTPDRVSRTKNRSNKERERGTARDLLGQQISIATSPGT